MRKIAYFGSVLAEPTGPAVTENPVLIIDKTQEPDPDTGGVRHKARLSMTHGT